MQCRANSLWGSLLMNSQKKAADWLTIIYEAANTAPVWSGFKLKSIPRSEVSAAGNGVVYTAPTSTGPIADLGPDDMIGSETNAIVSITRKATIDRSDLLRVQYPDRGNQYRSAVVSQSDPGALTLYGLRYATPKVFDCIADASVAQSVLGVMVRRQTQLVNSYEFSLQGRWKLLEAMDLITITDPLLGLDHKPVRLTSIEEDSDYNLKCTAEDFLYGVNAPRAVLNPATPVPAIVQSQHIPPNVNTPVFLEPPGALTGVAQNQFWIGISDSDPLYGGCQAYVSVDGGATYTPLIDENGSSLIFGNATTGVTTNIWPQALDPDTTNNLSVDLTESIGQLQQYTVTQEDQFLFPNYVSGGGGVFPFEIMTYSAAILTSQYNYTIEATGGSVVGIEDMLDWVMIGYPLRTTNHITGPGTYSANWCDADGLKFWLIKNTAGHPWDINTYDNTYIYHYITENADLSEPGGSHWSSNTAFKRHIVPLPVMPRFYDPTGGPVTITTPNPTFFTRTLACESDGEPLLNLGTVVETTSGPTVMNFGGDIGSQATIINTHTYGNQREQFFYCKGLGLIQWQHANLISGVWVVDQTTLHNMIVPGGCPTPNFPCYSSIPGPGFGGSWIGGVPGAGGNVNNTSGGATTGNKIRRAAFGTWASSSLQNTGPAHSAGSRFLFLDPTSLGVMKVNTPNSWLGQTIFFKFVQFNNYQSGNSTLSAATPYSYTFAGNPNTSGGGTGGSGGGGNVSYTISPTNPLSQTATTTIHMVNVTATFSPSGLQTFYVARNFTIAAPSSPITYYVTVFDPTFVGDTGNSATLTSFISATQAGAHVGQPGYIYMGNIIANPAGTGGGSGGGGTNPAAGSFFVEINGVPIV